MSLSREELEMAAVGARDLARVCKAQYDAFVEAGFDEAQALRMAMQWMRVVLTIGYGEADK